MYDGPMGSNGPMGPNGLMGTTYVPRKQTTSPWVKWFAWYPVKVNGRRTWLKPVYRRTVNTYVDMEDWKRYQYGNIFDVIRGDQ